MEQVNYKISRWLQSFSAKNAKLGVLFHSMMGNGIIVKKDLFDTITNLREKEYFPINNVPLNWVADFMKWGFIIPEDVIDEVNLLNPKCCDSSIRTLRLCISKSCNLNCSYCYQDKPDGLVNMPLKVSKYSIDKFASFLEARKLRGKVTFFGGEPLLNWSCLEKSINYCAEINSHNKYFSKISIVTNGTLIDKKKAKVFLSNDVCLAISLDGPREINDLVRRTKTGQGTYDLIIKGINNLLEVGFSKFGLLCTVCDHNVSNLKDMILLCLKYKLNLNLQVAFERVPGQVVTSPEIFADKIFEALLFAKKLGVRVSGNWRSCFERAFKYNKYFSHCTACGQELTVDVDGNIFPCPSFNDPIGNINCLDEYLNSEVFKWISERRAPNISECNNCEIEGLCGGACMASAGSNGLVNIYKKGGDCRVIKLLFKKQLFNLVDQLNNLSQKEAV